MSETRRKKREADGMEKKAKAKGVKTPQQLAQEARIKNYQKSYGNLRDKVEQEKTEDGHLKYIDVKYPTDLKELTITPQMFVTFLSNNTQLMRLSSERTRLTAEIEKIDNLMASYIKSTDFSLMTSHVQFVDQGLTEIAKKDGPATE